MKDEAEQAGGAGVLLKYLLNPVKELSGELRRLNNLYPCWVVQEDELTTYRRNLYPSPPPPTKKKATVDNLSSQ